MQIPVVVAAYNRPASLERLLKSLDAAYYPNSVQLIISIDKSDNDDVVKLAENYQWRHGKKELIIHQEHLGLKEHILRCGDLSANYDAVIVLEDDLFVSPYFYDYTLKAFNYYTNDPDIAGTSLYAHNYNETARLPFSPLLDGSDVFFMQIPSSWGQCWSKKQWAEFRKWINKNKDKEADIGSGLPVNALEWPPSSWKKYFFWYMTSQNRYFVYPRHSLTSNFCEPGTHYKGKEHFLQTPMLSGEKAFVFKTLHDSMAVYDSFCEILPGRLSVLQPLLNKHEFTCDLYGLKTVDYISTPYVLTCRKCNDYVLSFARELKPHEANVISNIPGREIFLSETKHCDFDYKATTFMQERFYYFFKLRDFQLKKMVEESVIVHEQKLTIKTLEENIKSSYDTILKKQQELEIINAKLNDAIQVTRQMEQKILHNEELSLQWQKLAKNSESLMQQANLTLQEKEKLLKEQENLITQGKIVIESFHQVLEQKDIIIEQEMQISSQLRKEIDSKNIIVDTYQTDLANKVEENKRLQIRLNNLEEEIKKHTAEYDSLLVENDLLRNSISTLNDTIILKENKIKELQQLIHQIEKSYTFRIGKTILWPAKKLMRRK